MIFGSTLKQVMDCEKNETRRPVKQSESAICDENGEIEAVTINGRIKWRVGGTYAVQPGRGQAAVARMEIFWIRKEPIQDIGDYSILLEGFKSRDDFMVTWARLHGGVNGWDRNPDVWVIGFGLI